MDVARQPARTPVDRAPPNAAAPKRILVGVDEGAMSGDALALADALARSTGAKLVVASIRPFWPESIPPGDYAHLVAEEEKTLRQIATPLLGLRRKFAPRVIAGGRVSEGLHELAVAEKSDLIVIASTHRGPVGRVLPGSAGDRILDGAPCAVAIAPHGLAGKGLSLRRIVVGCDGSRESLAAVQLGAAMAKANDAHLTLIGVVEMRFDLAGFPRPAEPVEVARIERALQRAQVTLPPTLAPTVKRHHGIAAEVLAAAGRDADLLVVGSRGRYGPLRRTFLGSVAAKLARGAPCATLITPG